MTTADQGFDDDFMATLLGEFLDESHTHLTSLNENLLALDEYVQSLEEGQPGTVDEDRLNEMFRAAHSLKGLSAMLSLDDINRLTHRTENVLDAARRHQLEVNQQVVDVVLQSVDHLTAMIQCLKDGQPIDVDYLPTLDAIQNLLSDAGVDAPKTRTLADELADELAEEGIAVHPERPASIPPDAGPALYYDHSMAQVSERERATVCGTEPSLDRPAFADELQQFDQLEDDATIPEKYVAIFLDESATCLDQMMEVAGSPEAGTHISQLMRLCHQLKGSAAAAGFHRAARLTHRLEDTLAQVGMTGNEPSASMLEMFVQTVDAL